MLQIASSKPIAAIERGNNGAVIVRASIDDRYEDWLFREFPKT